MSKNKNKSMNKIEMNQEFNEVSVIVKDEIGRVLVMYNSKSDQYTIPTGRVPAGMLPKDIVGYILTETVGLKANLFENIIVKKLTFNKDKSQLNATHYMYRALGVTGNLENRKNDTYEFVEFINMAILRNLKDTSLLVQDYLNAVDGKLV